MDKNWDIQGKIQATLDSLDGINKTGPGPFFYTRLQARFNRDTRNIWDKMVTFLGNPAVALAMIILVVFMNTAVILQERQEVSVTEQVNETTVSDEYAIASNSYADYVNQDPE